MTSWVKSSSQAEKNRRCKVLEVDGDDVLVQLYESAAGINLT